MSLRKTSHFLLVGSFWFRLFVLLYSQLSPPWIFSKINIFPFHGNFFVYLRKITKYSNCYEMVTDVSFTLLVTKTKRVKFLSVISCTLYHNHSVVCLTKDTQRLPKPVLQKDSSSASFFNLNYPLSLHGIQLSNETRMRWISKVLKMI